MGNNSLFATPAATRQAALACRVFSGGPCGWSCKKDKSQWNGNCVAQLLIKCRWLKLGSWVLSSIVLLSGESKWRSENDISIKLICNNGLIYTSGPCSMWLLWKCISLSGKSSRCARTTRGGCWTKHAAKTLGETSAGSWSHRITSRSSRSSSISSRSVVNSCELEMYPILHHGFRARIIFRQASSRLFPKGLQVTHWPR